MEARPPRLPQFDSPGKGERLCARSKSGAHFRAILNYRATNRSRGHEPVRPGRYFLGFRDPRPYPRTTTTSTAVRTDRRSPPMASSLMRISGGLRRHCRAAVAGGVGGRLAGDQIAVAPVAPARTRDSSDQFAAVRRRQEIADRVQEHLGRLQLRDVRAARNDLQARVRQAGGQFARHRRRRRLVMFADQHQHRHPDPRELAAEDRVRPAARRRPEALPDRSSGTPRGDPASDRDAAPETPARTAGASRRR